MITIGTDPELFLRRTDNGAVQPACGLLGGSKGKPKPLGDGFGVQEDNVMLEFNTPPTDDPSRFGSLVAQGLEKCAELVHTSTKGELEFDTASERLFGYDLLATDKAQEFGCSPEADAYDQGSPVPALDRSVLSTDDGEWRFAGGHVHFGYKTKFDIPPYVVASLCDLWLGLPSLGADSQPQRRALYGQPGRYRVTKYGIEYRTLSNFWVRDPAMVSEIANRTFSLGYYLEQSSEARIQKLFKAVPWGDVRDSIRNEDKDKASALMQYVGEDLQTHEVYGQ